MTRRHAAFDAAGAMLQEAGFRHSITAMIAGNVTRHFHDDRGRTVSIFLAYPGKASVNGGPRVPLSLALEG